MCMFPNVFFYPTILAIVSGKLSGHTPYVASVLIQVSAVVRWGARLLYLVPQMPGRWLRIVPSWYHRQAVLRGWSVFALLRSFCFLRASFFSSRNMLASTYIESVGAPPLCLPANTLTRVVGQNMKC